MPTHRTDHTNYLIHWAKGSTDEAFNIITQMAIDETIIGNNFGVRAGCNCICFSEAPIEDFHEVEGVFKPFGVMVSKQWLFSQGGRPVIYQPQEDFQHLASEISWKHVDFQMLGNLKRDYSWQREWRIKVDTLHIPTDEATIILPDESYIPLLKERFSNENFARGLASCDPFGCGIGYPHWPTVADPYPSIYIPEKI